MEKYRLACGGLRGWVGKARDIPIVLLNGRRRNPPITGPPLMTMMIVMIVMLTPIDFHRAQREM